MYAPRDHLDGDKLASSGCPSNMRQSDPKSQMERLMAVYKDRYLLKYLVTVNDFLDLYPGLWLQ
jgi:hypothetical protein